MRTWKILDEDADEFEHDGLEFMCLHCERWSKVATRGHAGDLIIAVIGMGVVFDHPDHKPPDSYLPKTIQCRHCNKTYGPIQKCEEE